MRVRATVVKTAALAGVIAVVLASAPPPAVARSKSTWVPNNATTWEVGGGGDDFRTGFAPDEKRPPFLKSGKKATGDADGPWLEWETKLTDLPSGGYLQAGVAVVDGIVYISGGATNSFVALDADTGLPVWRFQPDPRNDGYTAQYPASNAPIIKDGVVYLTFSSGWVYALDAKTGKRLWGYEATDADGNPDFYRDESAAMNPRTTAEEDLSPYQPETWLKNRDVFGPVHPGVPYAKIHGATGFCEGTVIVMTLSGFVHGIDAKTGKAKWRVQADAPHFPGELVWPEFKRGGALNPENKAAGMSTRRFEAVPGVACLHGEIQVPGSDGVVRFLDPASGKTKEQGGDVGPAYDRIDPETGDNFCVAAGFNCDIAVGVADPVSGDYILTTLDGRMIRLDWRTHKPEWRRQYLAPLPFESQNSLPLMIEHVDHGLIAQAVFGGPMAFDPERRVLFAHNQDGHLYVLAIPEEGVNDDEQSVSCPPGFTNIRPENATPASAEPCLIARMGMTRNEDEPTAYTRRGLGGPWDYNQAALSGITLGGDVLYVPTWDNRISGYDVRNPASPRLVWQHEFFWDDTYKYPPFGETFDRPFTDIELKPFSSPALAGGRLYVAVNDGTVYAFNLHERVKTTRNLVILGSGAVPFLPDFPDPEGAYDRVWTTADWYKNQVPPPGYRFPRPAGIATASTLIAGVAFAWWYVRRREDLLGEIEEMAP